MHKRESGDRVYRMYKWEKGKSGERVYRGYKWEKGESVYRGDSIFT